MKPGKTRWRGPTEEAYALFGLSSAIQKAFVVLCARANPVEAINGQLRLIRRYRGVYFRCEETLKLNLVLLSLHSNKPMENHGPEHRRDPSPLQCHRSIPF